MYDTGRNRHRYRYNLTILAILTVSGFQRENLSKVNGGYSIDPRPLLADGSLGV